MVFKVTEGFEGRLVVVEVMEASAEEVMELRGGIGEILKMKG